MDEQTGRRTRENEKSSRCSEAQPKGDIFVWKIIMIIIKPFNAFGEH